MPVRILLIATFFVFWAIGPTLAENPAGLEGWSLSSSNAQAKTRQFRSPDGRGRLITSQTHTSSDRKSDMDRIAYHDGERVTYQRRGRTWIAVSGYRGDRIFYRKSNLACHGTRWHNIEFVYPATDKQRMDRGVTSAAHIMASYSNRC
jgi:hypothetical protein